MTLSDAMRIRKYLDELDNLKSKLSNLQECDNISGHINIGSNGFGFQWNHDSNEVKHLIRGIESEIREITQTISDIKLVGSSEESEVSSK